MSEFLIGEALLGKDSEVAHIDLMMGDKSGPVGQAFATALINMSKGHTPLLAVLRPNLMPKPAMVIVPKVTIQNLEVFQANPERNLLLVIGAVPGARNGLVLIKKSGRSK